MYCLRFRHEIIKTQRQCRTSSKPHSCNGGVMVRAKPVFSIGPCFAFLKRHHDLAWWRTLEDWGGPQGNSDMPFKRDWGSNSIWSKGEVQEAPWLQGQWACLGRGAATPAAHTVLWLKGRAHAPCYSKRLRKGQGLFGAQFGRSRRKWVEAMPYLGLEFHFLWASSLTLGKLFNLPNPPFFHLESGNKILPAL